MHLLRAEQAKATNAPITAYTLIAKSLLAMDKSLQEKMGKKFDICFVLQKKTWRFANIQQSMNWKFAMELI